MFKITKEDLKDLLKNVEKGRTQLPEFQRSYVWNNSDVRSLIASVLKGFPVGALLTLETGGELRFKPRMLEGTTATGVSPEVLLLDGQQRMTSLTRAPIPSPRSKRRMRRRSRSNATITWISKRRWNPTTTSKPDPQHSCRPYRPLQLRAQRNP